MAKTKEAMLNDLLVQLKITNRLLMAQLKDVFKQNELVVWLEPTGASFKEIAELLGTTPAVVQVTLHRHRKKSASKES